MSIDGRADEADVVCPRPGMFLDHERNKHPSSTVSGRSPSQQGAGAGQAPGCGPSSATWAWLRPAQAACGPAAPETYLRTSHLDGQSCKVLTGSAPERAPPSDAEGRPRREYQPAEKEAEEAGAVCASELQLQSAQTPGSSLSGRGFARSRVASTQLPAKGEGLVQAATRTAGRS